MAQKSRTEYSAVNTTVALLSRIAAILMGFLTRVVFTRMLNENYVGINGLFTDILNVLSLTELGVGTAITYALYHPVAARDKEKQKSLMRLYCWFYRMVAAVVAVFGVAVIPFMDLLIKNRPDVDHLILIYLMYLANSVLSYLLIYKRTLIDAHQLIYVGTLYQTIFLVVQDVIQIIVLVTTKNFILFLSIYIVCTLLGNICISKKADSLYPYLKDRDVKPLPKEERKEILKNIKAMLMHKVGTVVVNNTDNLLLSSFVGIVSVGIYSNYYLVIGSVRQVLDQIFQGITASVGNLGVTEDSGRVRRIFETSFFVGQWMYGAAAICLYELLNPFVEISFGRNYLFAENIVLILCINFYINGIRKATLVFRDSLGLFWFDRYKSIVEALLNLIVSVLLVVRFGTAGVFIGTFISTILTSLWVEPYVLYKHHLKAPVRLYFLRYIIYSAVIAGCWYITDAVCRLADGTFDSGSILYLDGAAFEVLAVRFVICLIIPNFVMLLAYCRTKEFVFVGSKVRNLREEFKRRRQE